MIKISPEFVNDDGTPKVWYHSTNADFTSFKRGSGVLGDGIYFSDYSQGLYGKNIMEAYLTAENPINLRSLPRGAKEINSVGIETSVIPNFFEKFPQYDAIMDSRHGEIVVKNSEQIKSATDNIGTFDKGNKDIRFSKKKEPVKALKAEDVFGKDYKAEYAALKEETENIRKEIAALTAQEHIDSGYRQKQTERLTKILKNKEALLKRMDSLRTILAQLQARNANVSRYAKLFLDNFQAVKKTGSYRATGENWEIMKAVSEITDTYEPTVSDFATKAGLAKLQKEHKQIYDAFMAYARDKAYIRPFNLSECKSVLEKLAKEYKAEGADISGLAAELKNAVEIYLNKAADKQPSYEALVREFDVILSDITEKSEKLADKSEWAQKIKGQTVKLVGDQYRNVIDTFGSLAEANRYMNGAVKFSRLKGITLTEALDGQRAEELLRQTDKEFRHGWEVVSEAEAKAEESNRAYGKAGTQSAYGAPEGKQSAYGGRTDVKAYSPQETKTETNNLTDEEQAQAERIKAETEAKEEILDFAKAVHELFSRKCRTGSF